MSDCEHYEGLIAQSLYEELNEEESIELSKHLTDCACVWRNVSHLRH